MIGICGKFVDTFVIYDVVEKKKLKWMLRNVLQKVDMKIFQTFFLTSVIIGLVQSVVADKECKLSSYKISVRSIDSS